MTVVIIYIKQHNELMKLIKHVACGITKKGQKNRVKGHNYNFLLLTFPNLGHLECYNP